jgi:hypothetical protein
MRTGNRSIPSALRERLRAFYAYAFLPPSVTDEEFSGDRGTTTAGPDSDDFEGFEFGAWLESEAVHVEATAESTAGRCDDREFETFDFVAWLAADESGFEPISVGPEPTASDAVEAPATDAKPDRTRLFGLGRRPHPAKAATYALFVAMLTLAVLSAVGYAPVLGHRNGTGLIRPDGTTHSSSGTPSPLRPSPPAKRSAPSPAVSSAREPCQPSTARPRSRVSPRPS